MADHHDHVLAGGSDPRDRGVEAGHELVRVLPAGDACFQVTLAPGDKGADVARGVRGELVVTGRYLTQLGQNLQLEAARLRDGKRSLLRPHEVGRVDGFDRVVAEPLDEGRGLLQPAIVEVGAGLRGVQQEPDIRGGTAVADEDQAHGSSIESGDAPPEPRPSATGQLP